MAIFVIPAFNEEGNVPRLLDDLESRPALWGDGWVVLVDDGSSDGTVAAARAHTGDLPIEVLCQRHNQGAGRAFDRGFRRALEFAPEDALIVTLESDTTSDLDALEEMLATAHSGADVVLASHHDQGELVGVTAHRRFLSKAAAYAIRRTSGLDAKTVSSFFRVYRASALRAAYRRHGDELIRESGLRLQGRAADQARPHGRPDRRGAGGARLVQARGHEQAARAADDGRLRAPDDAAGRRAGAGMTPGVLRPIRGAGVGIVGGGLLGLATGYRLARRGVPVTVYEASARVGGLAGTTRIGGVEVDRYYHALTTEDERMIALAEELGLSDEIRWRPLGVGFFHDGRLASMSTPREALTFPGLTLRDKARMAGFVARCSRTKDHAPLDEEPLDQWVRRTAGDRLWQKLFKPLLDSKFDGEHADLPATYLWSRTRRTAGTRDRSGREVMGWIRGGHQRLADRLAEEIRTFGGEVMRLHPGPLHPVQRRARDRRRARHRRRPPRRGRHHDAAAAHGAHARPRAGVGAAGGPVPLPRDRVPRRPRAQERQPVLRAEHHRPADPADERGRDDPRGRSRARRRPPDLRAALRQRRTRRSSTPPRATSRATTSATSPRCSRASTPPPT